MGLAGICYLGVILSTVAAWWIGVKSLCKRSLFNLGGWFKDAASATLGLGKGCSGSSSGSFCVIGLLMLRGSLRFTKIVFLGTPTWTDSDYKGNLFFYVITIVGFLKVFSSWHSESWPIIYSKEERSSIVTPEDMGSNAFLSSTFFLLAKSRSDWLFERKPPPKDVTNFRDDANYLF